MEQRGPYPKGDSKVKWVSTDWLEEHLNDRMAIIDVQPNIHDYVAEHIPGATYQNEEFLRAAKRGLCGQFMCQRGVEPYFQRAGVNNDVPVLVYTGKGAVKGIGDGLEQTMMAYGLTRYGHDNVLILDGGLDKWKAEGRQTTQDFPNIETGSFKGETRGYGIRYEEFKAVKDNDDVIVLDARPSAVYEGKGPWRKGGHIPGAVNLPWAGLMSKDNTRLLKPDNEIMEQIERAGATRDKLVICSCGTGREATNEFNLFKWYLGYPRVRLHEGAFTEWTAHPENPTVMGKSPRDEAAKVQVRA